MRRKSRITIGVAAGVAVAAAGGGAALATSTGAHPAPAVAAATSPAPAPGVPRLQGQLQAFLQDLATRLDITQEKLMDAVKAAAADRVDALLAAGTITQQQANELKARIQAGKLPLPGRRLGPPHLPTLHGGNLHGTLDAAASYLGLTTAQLRTALASGKTLADLVRSTPGKTVDGLKQAITAAMKSSLDKAVAAGHLTAAQEQALLARLASRLDGLLNGMRHGPGPQAPGKHARMH